MYRTFLWLNIAASHLLHPRVQEVLGPRERHEHPVLLVADLDEPHAGDRDRLYHRSLVRLHGRRVVFALPAAKALVVQGDEELKGGGRNRALGQMTVRHDRVSCARVLWLTLERLL